MAADNAQKGIADCLRLHIYSKPDDKSEVVCKVRYLTDLIISRGESTDDYYKVYTAVGATGYCKKDQVFVTQ